MELIRSLFGLLERLFSRERVVRVELCRLKGFPAWVQQELVFVRAARRPRR